MPICTFSSITLILGFRGQDKLRALEASLFQSGSRSREEKRDSSVLIIRVRLLLKNYFIGFYFIPTLFPKGFEVASHKNWYIYLHRLVKIQINCKAQKPDREWES